MTTTTAPVALPEPAGGWREIELTEPRAWRRTPRVSVVGSPSPPPMSSPTREATTSRGAGRHRLGRHPRVPEPPLLRYGLGVAEAMDTAQRNMGLDWPATQELITRSAALAREHGARIASGAGTDQLLGAGRRPERGHPGLSGTGGVRGGRRITGDRDGLPAARGCRAKRR